MTILLNTTQHAIVYGSILLIPAKPVEVEENEVELKEKYPALRRALENGTLKAVTKTQAERAEKALTANTIEELKQFAENNNIDLTGLTKKDDIIDAIKKAKGVA